MEICSGFPQGVDVGTGKWLIIERLPSLGPKSISESWCASQSSLCSGIQKCGIPGILEDYVLGV